MSYLVAKHFNQEGAIALKRNEESAEADATYMEGLALKWLDNDVQILTVGDFGIYGEYEPVRYVESKMEFEKEVNKMSKGMEQEERR